MNQIIFNLFPCCCGIPNGIFDVESTFKFLDNDLFIALEQHFM